MDEAQVVRGLLDSDAGASTSCGSSCLLVLELRRSTAKLSERGDLMTLKIVSDWLNGHVAASGSSGTRARTTTFLFRQSSARPTQPIGKRYQRRAESSILGTERNSRSPVFRCRLNHPPRAPWKKVGERGYKLVCGFKGRRKDDLNQNNNLIPCHIP
jgi:hypothetical protein